MTQTKGQVQAWYEDFYDLSAVRDIGSWYQGVSDLMAEVMPAGIGDRQVFEVGCGRGLYLRTLPTSRKGGLDLSLAAAKEANRNGVPATVGMGEALPLPTASIDVLICCEVIEHVQSLARTLVEFHRVLKPGGYLFVSFPNFLNLPWLAARVLGDVLHKDNWIVRQPIDRYLTYPSVKRRLVDIGFDITASTGYVMEPPGLYHWRSRRDMGSISSRRAAALAFHPVLAARRRS